MAYSPPSQPSASFILANPAGNNGIRPPGANGSTPGGDPAGYTILVPANVRFRGVNMQLDLKIDQRTLAAAGTISKRVQESINSRGAAPLPSPSGEQELSSNLRRKTGGKNPRELLAEKLKKAVKKQKESDCLPSTSQVGVQGMSPSPAPSPSLNGHLRLPEPELLTQQQKELFSPVSNETDLDLSVPLSTKLPMLNGSGPPPPPPVQPTAPTPVIPPLPPAKRRSHSRAKGGESQVCEHFDPGKECRQRAILGYKFCIRHILDDPDSPYQACAHTRKAKRKSETTTQQCTNAVRKDRDLPYCSTHLIVMGMLEPKKKKDKNPDQTRGVPNLDVPATNGVPPMPSPRLDGRAAGGRSFSSPRTLTGSVDLDPCPDWPVYPASASPFDHVGAESNGALNPFSLMPSPLPSNGASHPIGAPFSPANSLGHMINGASGGFSPNTSSLARSSSVASASSRPESTLSLSGGLAHTVEGCWPPRTEPTPPGGDLQRSYPELSAKLHPGAFARPDSYLSSSAGQPSPSSFASPQPSDAPLPSLAGTLSPLWRRDELIAQQRQHATTHRQELLQLAPPETSGKKVIRLRQKRQRLRMLGQYRQIPAVNQMCKIIEDSDFDTHDLFPLGLEPSSSDTDAEEGDSSVGSVMTDRCLATSLLDFETNGDGTSGARRLYLLKKQLRLERHRLLQAARTNAAVLPAAKSYPNCVGRAMVDRKSNRPTARRRWHRAKKTARTLNTNHTHSFDSSCPPVGRCSLVGCVGVCLPYSNHCARHVLYNIDQRLFRYCSEPQCQQPVLDLSMLTGPRCRSHLDSRPQSSASCDNEKRKRYPSQRRLKRRRPRTRAGGTEEDGSEPDEPTMASSPADESVAVSEPSTSRSHLSTSSDSLSMTNTSAVKTDGDLSLASVVKDLGFEDDRELAEMLNKFPVDAFSSLMAQEFTKNGEQVSVLASSTSMAVSRPEPLRGEDPPADLGVPVDPGTHSWADVEQFLLSEGYRGSSFGLESAMPQGLPPLSSLANLESMAPPPPYGVAWSGGV